MPLRTLCIFATLFQENPVHGIYCKPPNFRTYRTFYCNSSHEKCCHTECCPLSTDEPLDLTTFWVFVAIIALYLVSFGIYMCQKKCRHPGTVLHRPEEAEFAFPETDGGDRTPPPSYEEALAFNSIPSYDDAMRGKL